MRPIILLLSLVAAAGPVMDGPDMPDASFFEAMRAADLKVAIVGRRLALANTALCDRRAPSPGILLHTLNQYNPAIRADLRSVFGFESPVAIEAVVPGSAADRAGLRANDSLVEVNGEPLPVPPPDQGTAYLNVAWAMIEKVPAGTVMSLTISREGRRQTVDIAAPTACRVRFELVLGGRYDASATDQIVEIGSRYLKGEQADDHLAAVAAHEFAHVVLRHYARLDAAKVSRGLAGEFGRNGRLIRKTEDQADELSVYLLANAGYNPHIIEQFWRGSGKSRGIEGLFGGVTHASARARAKAAAATAALIARDPRRPLMPALLATREAPLG